MYNDEILEYDVQYYLTRRIHTLPRFYHDVQASLEHHLDIIVLIRTLLFSPPVWSDMSNPFLIDCNFSSLPDVH